MPNARGIIMTIRDGGQPAPGELRWFADGLADGRVTDAQAGAFAMAVLLRGLDEAGRVALTQGMRDSGDVMGWDLPGPVIDKHSTGGVGDPVSLLLAPALAECGGYVPMISGRGLGHTGGTLDKLEAIPGYRSNLSQDAMRGVVAQVGCAIVGASHRIAPADRRLYLIRDISGSVESLDLITASILSKKLAAGLDALVLDVKTGSGAFMKTEQDAHALARALVDTAKGAGCATRAVLTDMSQPLARSAGNALEVVEVLDLLREGRCDGRLMAVTLALGAELLVAAGLAKDADAADARLRAVFASGAAAERFARMIAAQGGPADVFAPGLTLAEAPVVIEVPATRPGTVAAMQTEALGHAVVALGGGRLRDNDRIDPAVGLSDIVALGSKVAKGDPLARIHAAREDHAQTALAAVHAAITLQDAPFAPPPLVMDRVT